MIVDSFNFSSLIYRAARAATWRNPVSWGQGRGDKENQRNCYSQKDFKDEINN